MRSVVAEGVTKIWRGSFFPLMVSACSGAFYFMLLEQTRSFLRRQLKIENLTTRMEFAAAAFCGFVSGILPGFSEVVKINLQINRTQSSNSFDFVRNNRKNMFGVYFRSLILCMGMGTLCSGLFFSLYFYVYHNLYKDSKLVGLYSGATAGFITWNLIFILDTMKTMIIASGKEFSSQRIMDQLRNFKRKDLALIYCVGTIRGIISDSTSLFAYDITTKLLKHENI